MSLDRLPPSIEQDVQRFASQQHISHDEAIIKLIETGLKNNNPEPRIKGLSGAPMTDEEAAIVDEALAIAMEARRERSGRIISA